MLVRVFRAALFAGIVLAVWSFARPAQAATLAPFCDDRGATALAAPPALEASDEAVRRSAAPASSCETDGPLFGLAFNRAYQHSGIASIGVEPALSTTVGSVAPPSSRAIVFVAPETSPPYGVRIRVERPPRH